MKIALAQIHMRLGDIEGICSRIASQTALASRQGAQLLCVPAPLFAGLVPGALVDYANYEHDLMRGLLDLAAEIADSKVMCLVPAIVSCEGSPLFEAFLLKDGRVVPVRLTAMRRREGSPADPWSPPIFDVAGTRVAVTFDLARDLPELPHGCDLIIYFQVNGFDASNEASAAVAAVPDGHFRSEVGRAGVWMACMAPVGGYDEATYTGGSFVMDDGGRVVAMAPCFEETLLVQDIQRGIELPCVEDHELPAYNREEWLWEALRLQLRDTVAAAGFSRAVVPLSGDLPSALLAVLAVDALGSRNVFGVLVERQDVRTAAEDACERDRAALVREVASNLHIRLIERSAPDMARIVERDVSAPQLPVLRRELEALLLADVAREQLAYPLSALTKTDCALAPAAPEAAVGAMLAPFGDVYLTALEFIARMRNRASAALPSALVTLHAVEDVMARIASDAVSSCGDDALYAGRIASLLASLEPAQVDGALEAHIDRNLSFEDIPLATRSPEAVALLLMLVRRGEAARRRLPMVPVVSARAFAERSWPVSLAWSDLGRHGKDRLRVEDLAATELERIERLGAEHGERVRSEIMGLLGGLFGLTPEQQAELSSPEGQQRVRENLQQFEEQMQEFLGRMAAAHDSDGDDGQGGGLPLPGMGGMMPPGMRSGDLPFFSQN